MKTLNLMVILTVLVSGLSLNAMDDYFAQVKSLETQLQKLSARYAELDKEFREWNVSMVEEERELEPRFQWLWQEITKVNGQHEELKARMKQFEQKYPTQHYYYRTTGIWFMCGTSYESEKK